MGKLGKATVDRIRAMLAEGYSKTETATELGIDRKTVASYAVAAEPSPVPENNGNMGLPPESEVTKLLFKMQGIMGTPTLLGAVKQAHQDAIATAKLRVTHWPIYTNDGEEFTTEAMIQRLMDFIDYQEKEWNDDLRSLFEAEAEIETLKEFAEDRYEEGYAKAKADHSIYANCVYCGKPYQVQPRTKAHRFISEILSENEWGHTGCRNQAQYESERGDRALRAEIMR